MELDGTFRHAERIDKTKKVRTPEGSRYFDAPIGTPITLDMEARAKVKRNTPGNANMQARLAAANGKAPVKSKTTAGAGGKQRGRPEGAGRGANPNSEKYKARKAEYAKKIDAAKGEKELVGVTQKLQRDLMLSDDDYDKVLAEISRKGVDLGVLDPKKQPAGAKTVEPKAPPGAGRQKAKDAIAGGATPPGGKPSLKDRVKSRLAGRKENRPQAAPKPAPRAPLAVPPPPAKPARKGPRRPHGAVPTSAPEDTTDEAVNAQWDHFGSGDDQNTIGNAPVDGLWNHILINPRFEIKTNGNSGNATNFWVKDRDTDEMWMFKSTFFDGKNNSGKTEEALNDHMASALLNASGMKGADFKFAGRPGGPGMMGQRHWAEQHAPDNAIIDHADLNLGLMEPHPQAGTGNVAEDAYVMTQEVVDGIKNGPNPESPLNLVLFDYLSNNLIDRHGNNFLITKDKNGGMEFGIIDHGLAFGSVEDATGMDLMGATFTGFMEEGYRGDDITQDGSWGATRLVSDIADGDKATLVKQIEKQIAQFQKSNFDEVFDKLHGVDLTTEQMDWVDKWLGEYEGRLEWMADNIDEIADVILKRGQQ